MNIMPQTDRFWKYVMYTLAATFLVMSAIVMILWHQLTAAEIRFLGILAGKDGVYLIVAILILGLIVFFGLETIYHRYIRPVKKICAEADLIYTVNPSHRIDIRGNRDIMRLAKVINDFADLFENLNKTITEQILQARTETEKERNLLAAIMAELPQGVIICNKNGRILLYNSLAKSIFSPENGAGRSEIFLSLGRSVFHLIEREKIALAMEEIELKIRTRQQSIAAYLITRIQTGRLISLEIIPVLTPEKQMTGFILAFQDVTDELNLYDATHEKLSGLKQELSIRSHELRICLTPAPVNGRDPMSVSRELSRLLELWPRHYEEISRILENILSVRVPQTKKHQSPVIAGSRPEFYDFNLFGPDQENSSLMDTPLQQLGYTVFDTETTGLDPEGGDEILSLAGIRIVHGRIVYQDIFEELVDPKRDIPMESYKIHGIRYEMVAGKQDIRTILPRFRDFAADTVLVGHNIAFDMKMFKVKEKDTGVRILNPILDTLLLSAVLHPVHERHDMESIAKRLGVSIIGRHTALGDAIATAEIFLKLLPILHSNGILTLRDAIQASRKTYYARLSY